MRFKSLRKHLLLIFVFVMVLALPHVVRCEGSARIWTDKADYAPGETVTIFGSGFLANAKISLSVTWPDSQVDSWSNVTSDSAGNFVATYYLVGMDGTFTVTATDGTNTATTKFTDSISVSDITSSNSGGTPTTSFLTSDSVYIKFASSGSGNTVVDVYVVTSSPSEGATLSDARGSPTSITMTTTNQNSLVWSATTTAGTYYLVMDYNCNGKYNDVSPKKDLVSSSFTITAPTVSIMFQTGGMSNDASETVLTIDSTAYTYSQLPQTFTWTVGSTHSVTASTPVSSTVSGKRYGFSSWTNGDGLSGASGTYTTPASDTTVTANYVTQYELTMATNFGTTSPSVGGGHWYDAGSTVTIQATAPAAGAGEQYVWNGWTGSGTGSYTGSANPATNAVTMNGPITETASWTHQFYITVNSAHDTPTPSAWVNAGDDFTASVTSPDVVGPGHQWICTGYSIDGGAPVAGTTYTFTNVQADHTITFNWQEQYYLTVNTSPPGLDAPTGQGWYDTGDTAHVSTAQYEDIVPGSSRYRFDSWTGATGTYADATVVMDSAKTATANYIVQYWIIFDQTGVGTDFTGTVVIIDGVNYDRNGHADWYDDGASITYAYQSPLNVDAGKRYVKTSVDSSPLTVSAATTVTGTYKTQYLVSFTQAGSGVAPTVDYTADTDPTVAVPFGIWVKAGTDISYTYQGIVDGAPGVRYVLISTNPTSPQTVNSPLVILGTYQTQYQVSFAVNPPGSGTTNPSGTNVWEPAGALPISATPNLGYAFTSWTSDTVFITFADANSASTTATINSPGTITANFIDIVAPTTGKTLSGIPGLNNWYTSDIDVTLTATDNPGGSGVKEIHYILDGGTEVIVAGNTATFTITTEGTHTLAHWAVDNAGNEETHSTQEIKIDKTAPSLTKDLDGTLGNAPWWISDVTVTLIGSDDVSGVALIEYSFDGVTWLPYTGSFTIADEGTTTLYHRVTDNAGNVYELPQQTIKIDKTAPVVSIITPANGASYQTETVPAAAYTIIEANTYAVVETGYSTSPGLHTYIVTATDDAGNTGSASVTYTVYNTVTFTQTGLPAGTSWSVTLNGITQSSTTTTITFTGIPSGSHPWTASNTISGATGIRYVASTSSGTITAPTQTSQTITYTTQYYLTVNSAYSTAGGAGWYDSGTTAFATLSATTVDGAAGTRYVFTSWSGDATGATSPSNAIVMNAPKTATANWKTQYYLTVESTYGATSGGGWYDSGSSAYATITPVTVAGPTGIQHVFTGWIGDATGTTSISNAITMNSAKTATATWKTQYYLTTSTNYGAVSPSSGWYDAGTILTISATVPAAGANEQYIWNGWTGSGVTSYTGTDNPATNAITMNGPVSETASWTKQYYIDVAPTQTITLISNFTITDLAFSATSGVLSFNADGPSGTTGYIEITIPKSLVLDPTNITVYVDGVQISYSITSTDDSWLLSFNIALSTHEVFIHLPVAQATPPPPTPLYIVLIVIIILLTVTGFTLLLFGRRRQKEVYVSHI